ncbi:helix-turn-helix domain-containing protein [Limnoglobus roseus]|uniref:DNA-binding protein n=1 Tax=Limnoglobus roseus TaxID=2598579 RepID=A0A5C1A7R8_9BACT|nr:helix-turn-helix domain-containing protein [Limnoglobus roseus]QEL14036.1 DNA-binding protein [Limnoglobus roseus]
MTAVALPSKPMPTDRLPGQPWPIADAAKFFALSIRSLTRAAEAGKLRVVRIGRLVYVPDAEVRRVANDGL